MRIKPVEYDSAAPEARAAHDEHERCHARMTNMKRTLLHSLPAFQALMEWYPLRDTVRTFLGDRATTLFAHAISVETDCLICSTFFRRILSESGDDPDNLELDVRDTLVIEFGRQLAGEPKGVSDDLYGRLTSHFSASQIVALTTFGCIMLATNFFNDALRIELDGYLEPYRRRAASGVRSA
ncbi:MAG: carboxymuconolactone decarboxylase family protein [Gemmatimonadaceae bacterium]